MVSYNVYKATSSGAYVEGVCLASDEKPVVGIANGSILYAVDASNGETTRYMYDKSAMAWIEAECPCSGGGSGSGSGSGSGGGNANILIVHITVDDSSGESTPTLDKTYSEIDAAISEGNMVFVDTPIYGNTMLSYAGKYSDSEDQPASLMFSLAVTVTGEWIQCVTLMLDENNEVRVKKCSVYSQGGS